jgi:ribonuclease HII
MIVLGIDEVGRGCWAGPLVVGAVVLARRVEGLKDSKLLSRSSRQRLSQIIYSDAADVSLGWVSALEVDRLGLTQATHLAIVRALERITAHYDEIIIDGSVNYLKGNNIARALIKADMTIPSVSAASIVAKVARDEWMIKVAAKRYPDYYFEKHVGYGTRLHSQALANHGACAIHRMTYKPLIGLKPILI